MKTIIAGSRDITEYYLLLEAIHEANIAISEIVSGGARGVDTLGVEYAKLNGIKFTMFYADWDRLGRKAGYIRNSAMADYADALIAVWDGESKGTKHMIDLATKAGLRVHVYHPDKLKELGKVPTHDLPDKM